MRLSLPRALGLAAAAAIALALPAGAALASPVDSTGVTIPVGIFVSPPHPCVHDTVRLVARSSCSPCVTIASFGMPTNGGAGLIVEELAPALCATLPCTPQEDSLALGVFVAGQYQVVVGIQATVPLDSLGHDSTTVTEARTLSFTVSPDCANGAPTFVQLVTIAGSSACDSCAPAACPGLPIPVTVAGHVDGCWHFGGLVLDSTNTTSGTPAGPPAVLALFKRTGIACPDVVLPFEGSIDLPPLPPGAKSLRVVEVHDDSLAGSVTKVGHTYAFTVKDSCAAPPPPPPGPTCVWPYLDVVLAVPDSGARCDLVVPPGGLGTIVFDAHGLDRPLAGIQGTISAGPHLKIVGAEKTGAATYMNLLTQPTDAGLRYVLYATRGAPIPAGMDAPVLAVHVRADSAGASGQHSYVSADVSAGSDSLGKSLPPCPIEFLVLPAAHVCITAPGTCDANGDQRVDVADLVTMVRCQLHPATCADSSARGPDCNGDGVVDLEDVMCCARVILSGSGGGTRAASQLRFSFGSPSVTNGIVNVPLEVSGASEMNGALLHVRFPSDRYEALGTALAVPVAATTATSATSGWVPLAQAGPDDLILGLLKLDDDASNAAEVPLYFRLRDGQSPGGQVALDQSSVIAPDGAGLTVDLSQAIADLPTSSSTLPTRIELRVGPNPSPGSTRFVVRLPQAGLVDLAVYDLAGRRVASLWHGAMAAGERTVAWDGSGTTSGLYFARLAVNGTVRTTRITMQIGR